MSSDVTKQRLAHVGALASGIVFGLGLLISRMADPGKVLGFLDVLGGWDPSLALVMVSAISISALAFTVAERRSRTFIGLPMALPRRGAIDGRLIAGSVLFGVGWGLSGICPGPAVVSAAAGHLPVLAFFAAMLVGLAVGNALTKPSSASTTDAAASEPATK